MPLRCRHIAALVVLSASGARAFRTPVPLGARFTLHHQPPASLQPPAAAAILADVDVVRPELDEWAEKVATDEVQTMRQDLIDQFLQLGRDLPYAEEAVDSFLADPARSRAWVHAREQQWQDARWPPALPTYLLGGVFFGVAAISTFAEHLSIAGAGAVA